MAYQSPAIKLQKIKKPENKTSGFFISVGLSVRYPFTLKAAIVFSHFKLTLSFPIVMVKASTN